MIDDQPTSLRAFLEQQASAGDTCTLSVKGTLELLDQLESWKKTAQEENDRALELEVRLEALTAAFIRLAVPTAALLMDKGSHKYIAPEILNEWEHALEDGEKVVGYQNLAVPARGEGRAPEGGSTPPAAIALEENGICDVCGGQFSDLAAHKSLGIQTHPWLNDSD